MKRIFLNEEELKVIEALRAERAIYNHAIADAIAVATNLTIPETASAIILAALVALRKDVVK